MSPALNLLAHIFRWTAGGTLIFLVTCALVAYVVGLSKNDQQWRHAGQVLNAWTRAVALFWFNVEIWGRVVGSLALNG